MKANGNTFKHCEPVTVCENDAGLLRSIMDNPNGMIIFALDREYRYISFTLGHKSAMKALWECDIELGKCVFDYIPGEKERNELKSHYDRAFAGESFVERKLLGNTHWEARYSPILGENSCIDGMTAFVVDITELVLAEEKLRKEAIEIERLKERELIFNSIGEGLYGVDLNGNCTFINHEALRLLGFEEHEVIGRETHTLFHHHHEDGRAYAREDCIIHRSLALNSKSDEVTWLFKKNGDKFPVRAIATPINDGGNITGVVIAFCDMTEKHAVEVRLKSANTVLKMLATTDPLTGLYNRRYFEEKGAELIKNSLETGRELSAAMFDIDFFKKINDQYGHSVGDMVLVKVASTVMKHMRKEDVFARIGGEEFVVLLPSAGFKDAVEISERIRKSIESAETEYKDEKIKCTVSIGVTCVSEGITNLDGLLKRADDRLYAAKHQGRNRVVASG